MILIRGLHDLSGEIAIFLSILERNQFIVIMGSILGWSSKGLSWEGVAIQVGVAIEIDFVLKIVSLQIVCWKNYVSSSPILEVFPPISQYTAVAFSW